ncbi:hypothetical protein EYF80_008273 [Liparis tanakae]|uniref:Uncharacterized protein n=1 Tax=Liparis tanakae TaxID=230148 RepID=A0A4Z2IUL3_9TELE|nr:hypothetical protein EYF80_008273 [Liparis tanakae]
MRLEMNLAFCVLVVLTGSSQTRGQSSALPPVLTLAAFPSHAGRSASPDLPEDRNEITRRPHGGDETSTETTTITTATIHLETVTNAVSTTHSSVTTPQHIVMPAPSPSDPFATFSSLPAHTEHHSSSTAHASTLQPQSESWTTASTQPTTTGPPLIPAPDRGPAGPTYQEVPSELNVGDEDLKGPSYHSSSPLDPLLAGLLSVFIVTTAIVFAILFLKFRQRTNHPEFHRLQDLPMDDLMEDTPLSRYTY